jgi:hypothetical protein
MNATSRASNPSAAIWVSALALFFVSLQFIHTLVAPLAWRNLDLAASAGVIVLAEFFAVHAGGFAVAVGGQRTVLGRAIVAAVLLLLYALFLYVLWTTTRHGWVVCGVGMLIVVRYARVALVNDGLREVGIRAGVNLFVYFTLVFSFLFMLPKRFPLFGFDSEALSRLRDLGGSQGLWTDEPQRAVAWCALYFFVLGALELLWLRGAGAPEKDRIALGGDGPQLQLGHNAYQVLMPAGVNWQGVGGILIAAMFIALGLGGIIGRIGKKFHIWNFLFGEFLILVALMPLVYGLYCLGKKSGIAVEAGALRIWETWFGWEIRSAHIPTTRIVSIEPRVVEQSDLAESPSDRCVLHLVTRDHGELDITDDLKRPDAEALKKLLAWLLEFRWEAPRLRALLDAAPEVRALLGERGVSLLIGNMLDKGAAAP